MHIYNKTHVQCSLQKFKIFIIKIKKKIKFTYLVLNAVFTTVLYVKAVQDDNTVKTIPI